MNTLQNILSTLAALHTADAAVTALPVDASDGEEDSLMAEFTAAETALWHMAPAWFKDAASVGGLHGTGLAGDPVFWALDDVAELCAILAIAAL
jgi:hypothetical protein